MDKEIYNEVTIVSLDKMIYHAMYEIRAFECPDFLDGNEIAESIFWERLRTLEIEGKILNKPSGMIYLSLVKKLRLWIL